MKTKKYSKPTEKSKETSRHATIPSAKSKKKANTKQTNSFQYPIAEDQVLNEHLSIDDPPKYGTFPLEGES